MLKTGPDIPAIPLARESRTLGDMFLRRARKSDERPAMYVKRGGEWRPISWAEFAADARKAARGLVELGLAPGERVAILGPTQTPWCVYDMGAQLAGLVSMGIYPKQAPDQIRYLLEHSEARVVFVDCAEELERVLEAARELETLTAIVPWDAELLARFAGRDPRLTSPERFCGAPIDDDELERRQAAIDPEDTAILVYTSGTTGPPKGAMITHRNILSLLGQSSGAFEFRESDISLVFLPMAHVAERVLSFYGRVNTGTAAAYATSIGSVLTELGEVQPTQFGSVPRIFEKAYAKIYGELERKPAAVQRLFRWAERVGRRRIRRVLDGERVPVRLELQYKLADALVFKKIRAAFGGRVRQFVTGAAPIAYEILEFFWAAGLPIYEVYGMTEATVMTHCNAPGAIRLGSVGLPLDGVECRLADDGEILIRADWVFKGYLKNDEATRKTVQGGWLYTGDIGEIDAKGYLKITDRKKHIIITAGGKNLAPANIENAIKNTDPLISQVHAHGDRRAFVSAVVATSPIETLEWGRDRGLVTQELVEQHTRELMANPSGRSAALAEDMARVVEHPEFRQRIQGAVARGNRELARVEQIRKFVLLGRDFSQEEGELTPTMKVRRGALEKKFADELDKLYDAKAGYGLEPG
ncbi:MAG: long-chain fatty acid--CoA ligase [Myxococcales bacterium]|nr:long-chain fatty acid--CoA ligase [Myxococcales bacterium]MCB9749245.1 long-chain fatty acid--CoA ligase [Myxococcales bacterium]